MRKALLAVFITLLLNFPAYATGPEPGGEVWRVKVEEPVTQIYYELVDWLKQAGLNVESDGLQNGTATMKIDRVNGHWQLQVIPQSVLGAEVVVRAAGGGEDALLSELKLFLEGDIKAREELVPEASVLPSPILNQIENVACVHVESGARSIQSSGFFIDSSGLVLATAHDLIEHDKVKVMSSTGMFFEGDVIKADFKRDLALIQVRASKEEIVSIGSGRNLLVVGERVYSIGCPRNLRGTVHKGFINGPPRKVNETFLWQAAIEVEPGSSGSPVFDNEGALVGVIKGRHREDVHLGFVIPLEIVVEFLQEYFDQ